MKPHRAPHSIQLAVSDLATTEAFYAGILELPLQRPLTVPGAPEHLLLDMEGVSVIFVEEQDVARNHQLLGHRLRMFPKGIGITLHFQVSGIEEISDALMEENLEILYPLDLKPYGVKEIWCFDPDGYLVVLDEPATDAEN